MKLLWIFACVQAFLYRTCAITTVAVDDESPHCQPCYRRQLTGKKIAENHVRRTVETDKINNCLRACNSERSFTCRGFSYSQDRNDRRGSCEMTAMPYSGMDEYRDFEKSTNYDYFERDINCDRSSQSGWSNYPATRTQNSYYDYPAPPPSSKHFSSRPKAPYYDDYEKDMAVYRDHRPSPGRRTYGPFRTYGSYEDRYPSDRFSSDRFTPERDQGQDRNYYGHRDTKNYMRPDDEYYRRTYQQKYPSRFDGRHDLQYPGSNDLGPYEPNRRVDPDDYWRRRKIYNEYYGRDNKYFNGAGLYQRIPGDRDNFYHGTYGKEYGYGMEHKTHHNEYAHGDLGNLSKCSVRSAVGFKLGRKTMGKTYLVPNLGECEKRCLDERDHPCFTFSYRYNVDPMDPTDNCWLSDTAYLNVNFYTDLEPDRNYDIYAQIGDPKICAESKDSRRSKDDCFWRVKSGFGMPPEVIRQTVLVGHFSDCQSICISSTEFTCRSFTFRFGSKTAEGHSANCDLSDWPSLNIDDSGLVDMDGAEIYERGSFERGCEAYPLPMFIPTKDNPRPDSYYNRGDDESTCYAAQRRPCKLSPFVVTTSSHTKSELECRAKCSNIRIHDHTPCMSYSYKFDGDDSIDNCLISDVSSRDLRPGVDYIYDDNHVLYSWNELDPQCSLPGGVHGYHLSDPGNDDQTSPMFNRPVQLPFNHGGYIYYDSQDDKGPPYKLDCDTTDNKFPKYLPPGCRDRYPTPRPGDGSVYGRYTVSGIPCKRGTKCERNPVLGFWSCETEDSEPGSFEYCCEPSHQCGFSQRTEYPWCYVGLEESQWRPCNDKYTPYTHSRIPTYQPPDNGYRRSQTHRSFDERARNDHYSRHWPVVYLHSKPPPNVTDSTTLSSVRKETIYKNSVNVTSTTTTKRPEVTTVGNRTVTTNTTG